MGEKKITSRQLWLFAYEDGSKTYYPQAIKNADRVIELPDNIWRKKYNIITKTYRFLTDSFEAVTTPKREAFWCCQQGEKVKAMLKEKYNESSASI